MGMDRRRRNRRGGEGGVVKGVERRKGKRKERERKGEEGATVIITFGDGESERTNGQ